MPSLRFCIRHSELGILKVRTVTTVFAGDSSYAMVSYIPDNQQALLTTSFANPR
jgi:hypothetical protein